MRPMAFSEPELERYGTELGHVGSSHVSGHVAGSSRVNVSRSNNSLVGEVVRRSRSSKSYKGRVAPSVPRFSWTAGRPR